MKTIAVIDDDIHIGNFLEELLQREGYAVIRAYSGTEAVLLLERQRPDLVLLDLMLPGLSGEELLRDIREERHLTMPVLVLSAKAALGDKVSLLRTGADDYITKPFEPEEVAARVQAALRRGGLVLPQNDILSYKNLKLYSQSRRVTVNGKELTLTAHEYDLLYLFLQAPEKVYTRESLYELAWQDGYYGENNTVNVHVSNLRKKIKEADASQEYIQTVYGIGFRLG